MSEQPYAGEPDNRVRFQLKLPRDLHHRLKVAAATQGESMNDMLVRGAEGVLQALAAQQQEAGR